MSRDTGAYPLGIMVTEGARQLMTIERWLRPDRRGHREGRFRPVRPVPSVQDGHPGMLRERAHRRVTSAVP